MRIDEFEFQDRNGNEMEPTKNQLVVYIKSLHKQIAELQKQLKETKADLFLSRNEIDTLKNNLSISQEHKKIIEEQYLEKCKELKSQPAEIIDEIKKQMDARKLEYISHLTKKHCYGLRIDRIFEILDAILKEYQM